MQGYNCTSETFPMVMMQLKYRFRHPFLFVLTAINKCKFSMLFCWSDIVIIIVAVGIVTSTFWRPSIYITPYEKLCTVTSYIRCMCVTCDMFSELWCLSSDLLVTTLKICTSHLGSTFHVLHSTAWKIAQLAVMCLHLVLLT